VFRTGLEKATFLKVPKYYPTGEDIAHQPPREAPEWPAWRAQFRGYGFDSSLSDNAVRERMENLDVGLKHVGRVAVPFSACAFCRKQCLHRDRVFAWFATDEAQSRSTSWLQAVEERNMAQGWDLVRESAQAGEFAAEGLRHVGWPADVDLAWCCFLHAHDIAKRTNNYDPGALGIDAMWRPGFDAAFNQYSSSVHAHDGDLTVTPAAH
jgi:hypothetical protein